MLNVSRGEEKTELKDAPLVACKQSKTWYIIYNNIYIERRAKR